MRTACKDRYADIRDFWVEFGGIANSSTRSVFVFFWAARDIPYRRPRGAAHIWGCRLGASRKGFGPARLAGSRKITNMPTYKSTVGIFDSMDRGSGERRGFPSGAFTHVFISG